MAKLNRGSATARTAVLGTTGPTTNAEGSPALARDARSELFLTAVGAFHGEDKFYESASDSSKRLTDLVSTTTTTDPAWTAAFLVWLRTRANIRTAAIVGAAEYVRAGGPNGRTVVRSVLTRADEPGEMLAYWHSKYGRRIPQPVKRGLADAARALYVEATVAKWDSSRASIRFADVIELTHPVPQGPAQSGLFKYLLDERHGRATFEGRSLPLLEARDHALRSTDPREALLTELAAGNRTVTWETVSSAGAGKMTADQWERLYPHMGYMARIRNLRNLDEAGMSPESKRSIGQGLADPANVARSKQLPMRFLSAYKAVPDLIWGSYLSTALDHSLDSVPEIPGRWLVLVDASGSMCHAFSKDSTVSFYEAACVFAAAFARRNTAEIRTYSDDLSKVFPQIKGESTLATVRRLGANEFWFAGSTNTVGALKEAFDPKRHDRVLVLTDEVYGASLFTWRHDPGTPDEAIPADVPMYTFNLAGYRTAQVPSGPNRISVGGLSDAGFTMMAAVESTRGGRWPWEA